MADLDYMLRSNTADTSNIPDTGSGTLDHAFANSIKTVGTAVTYSAGTFTLVDAGLYLVTYTDEFETSNTTNNERFNWKTELIQGGSAVIPGRSSGYIRKSGGSQEMRTSGSAIINSAGSESLLIRSTRFDNSTTGTCDRVANQGAITIMKLEDANSFGIYSQSSNTAAASGDGTEADIALNTTTLEEGPHTRTGNAIDIDTSGQYVVCYTIPLDASGSGRRTEFTAHLELDGVPVVGSHSQTYMRTTDNTDDGCLSWGGIIDVVANEDLVLRQVRRDGEASTINYLAGTGIQIWQLPAGADAAIAEATSDNFNTAGTNQLWDTNPVPAADSFDFSAGVLSTDAAVGTDDYLAFFTQSVTSFTSATRAVPAGQLRVGTTDKIFGGSTYNRNNSQSGWGAIGGGGILDDVAQGTNLHVRNNRLGTNTTTMTCGSGQLSVLRLGSLTAVSHAGTAASTMPSLSSSASGVMNPSATAACTLPALTQSATGGHDPFPSDVAAINTNASLNVDTTYLIRVRLENKGGLGVTTYRWVFIHEGGAKTPITTVSSFVRAVNAVTFANDDDVTELIGGSGSYKTNNDAASEDGTVTLPSSLGAVESAEFVLAFQLLGVDIANLETGQIRLELADGTPFDSYDNDFTYTALSVVSHTGTSSQTLPSLTQAASGSLVFTGTAIQTLPSLEQVANAVEIVTGTSVQTLPSLEQVATGLQVLTGTAIQTLPSLEQVANGLEVITGTSEQTLPSLEQLAAGTHVENLTGTSLQTLPSIEQVVNGLEIFTSSAIQTLPSLEQQATVSHIANPNGSAIQTLPSIEQVVNGVEVFVSTSVQTLPSIEQAANGNHVENASGTSAQTLPSIEQVANGQLSISAISIQTLPSIEQLAAGTHVENLTGSSAQTLPSIEQLAAGVEIFTSTSALTLPSIEQQATVAHINNPNGSGNQTLPSIEQVANGIEVFVSTSVQTLPSLEQLASGNHVENLTGTSTQTLPSIEQLAAGAHENDVTGTSFQTLPSIEQLANGLEIFTSTSDQTLPSLDQLANAEEVVVSTSQQALPSLEQQASLIETISSSSDQTLPSLEQQATGIFGFAGSSNQELPSLEQLASGLEIFVSTVVQELPSLEQQATGVHAEDVTGTGVQRLPSLEQLASGLEIFTSSSSQTLPSLEQLANALEIFEATSAMTLPSLEQLANALEIFEATSAMTLPSLEQVATGLMQPTSTSAMTLPSLEQLANALSLVGLLGTSEQVLPGLQSQSVAITIAFIRHFIEIVGRGFVTLPQRGQITIAQTSLVSIEGKGSIELPGKGSITVQSRGDIVI